MFDLRGKRAVVTGASRGIGQAVAIALARAGADVSSLHLPDPEGAASTQAAIAAAGRRALMIEGDVTDASQVDDVARRVGREWGGLDIWINNAARMLIRPFLEMAEHEWRELLDCNLNGYFNGCRAALQEMLARGCPGRIVNIASITSHQPPIHMAAYATAKGGVVSLTRSLAVEFARHGIAVNAIAPGAVVTPLTAAAFTDEVRNYYETRIALGRLAEPDDIAGPVLFLASEAARYVHGQVLVVDGGLTLNGSVTLAATA